MAGPNSGTVTPLTSSNSLGQQIDDGALASVTEPTTEQSLNGTLAQYASNAAAKAAGLPVGSLYLLSSDPHELAMVQ